MEVHPNAILVRLRTEGDPAFLEYISDLVIGNMVNPQAGHNTYWAGPFNTNPWVWHYTSQANDVPFGLMANYRYKGVESTAYSKLVISPNLLEGGNYIVDATLVPCEIGPGNVVLRFDKATITNANGEPGPPDAVAIVKWNLNNACTPIA